MRKVYAAEWQRRNPKRRKQISKKAADKDPERTRQLKKYQFYKWKTKIVSTVLEQYSNGNPKCACCGESNRDFLTVDHIEGHGNEHRRKLFGRSQSGWQFYAWLIREGFPSGFQILCFNCNMSKAKHGKCVHLGAPILPICPAGLKPLFRTPGIKPKGDEHLFVRWSPRKDGGQAFKGSAEAGEKLG